MISPDFVLLAAGLIKLNLLICFILIAIASILSSLLFYSLGYIKGEKFALCFVKEESYEKYNEMFKRKGKFALSIAALTPVPYLPIIPGVFKMHLIDFLLYGVTVRILKYGAIALVLFFIIP